MKSILSLAAVAALAFSDVVVARSNYPAAALQYRQIGVLTYQGCYSSAGSMTFQETYTWQSKGHCREQCTGAKKPVQAQTNAKDCYCGNAVPPASAKVDDSKCSVTCSGYKFEMCGGDGFYTVWLDGLAEDVPGAISSGSKGTPASTGKPTTSPTTSASTSVIYVEGSAKTVLVTAPPNASTSGSSKSSGGGPNKAAIAAGVVVGIVIIAAIAGGVFLFLRNRRRRAIEEEHRRNAAVSSFINGSKSPASSGGASSFTDTRLDPVMANRRFSDGSIADNQDYSRRILKVTNA